MKPTLNFKRMTMLALVAMGSLVSCKSSTEPTETIGQQAYDSQASADVTAAAIGTKTDGAGAILTDAWTLGNGGTVSSSAELGKDSPQSRDTSYDPNTKVHTITFTRNYSANGYTISGRHVYTYVFYDASGNAMEGWIKGTTDKLVITEVGNHNAATPRATVADSSNGNWTIVGFATQAPVLNGSFTRSGQSTLNTPWNPGRTITHTFTINYTNDAFNRAQDGDIYLTGNANSSFAATSPKGNFTRTAQITFNNDQTATLNVTRTSGNGTVDTYTIDVKQGFWLRDGR